MFIIHVWLTVKEAQDIVDVREALAEAARLSRKEEGCERFEVYQSESDPARFLLTEHWRSKADWETHRGQRAFSEIYQPRVLPRVNREAHVCVPVA